MAASARMTAPAKAEATGADTRFEFDGVEYVVSPSSDWDLDAIEALENGEIVTCVRLLIGDEQWARFKPAGTKRKLDDLKRFFETLQAAGGLGSGN